jgi:hypothetical protein
MATANPTATRPTTVLPGPAWLANFERANGALPDNGNLTSALHVYFDCMASTLALIMFESDDGSADDQHLARMIYHQTEDMRAFFERWVEGSAASSDRRDVATLTEEQPDKERREGPSLTGLLSDAYRSNRELVNLLVTMFIAIEDINAGANPGRYRVTKIDLSWTAETAREIAMRGYKALIDAGKVLGIDEDDLARFSDADTVEAEINGEVEVTA